MVECDILNLLNTLFSSSVIPEEKKKVLSEKYNIAMTTELDVEVDNMCNLSSAIERKGIALGRTEGWEKGWKEGRIEGRIEGVGLGTFETTVKYYKKGRITAEEAAGDLNLSLSEFLEKKLKERDVCDKNKGSCMA